MFVNLDSSLSLPKGTEEYIASYLGYLSTVFPSVNRYLVSPQTMDVLYPPRKRFCLDENCLKEVFNREICYEDIGIFWEKCALDCLQKTKGVIAVGLYLPAIPESFDQIFNLPDKPSIFLCPERIYSWAKNVSNSLKITESSATKILSAAVTLHELAHAYMDGGNSKGLLYERVIEESLANAAAYELLSSTLRNRAVLRYAFSLQPLEYRAYVYWQQYKTSSSFHGSYALKLWRDRVSVEKLRNRSYLKVLLGWLFPVFLDLDDDDYYYYLRYFLRGFDYLLRHSKNKSEKHWQLLAASILKSVV